MPDWLRPLIGTVLASVPIMAVFGNTLVILAVRRERTLQTVTNMLIVSLAVSDFLVAICVMSFGVYHQMNDFSWGLGQFWCNCYLAADVACSTASILNLVAISLDRYMAISHPLSYAQYGARNGRAAVSIAAVWSVSLAVALPLLFGVNQMDGTSCELSNPYFNILSSLFSFFLPCTAMIALYTVIFRRLKQRERARSMRQAHHGEVDKISTALLGGARMARQMGRHFKNKTDQILLEISFQTSSFPTNSNSSEDDPSSISPSPFLPDELEITPKISKAYTEPQCLPSLRELQESLSILDSTISKNARSFGENLEEFFPFIDLDEEDSNKSSQQSHTLIANGSLKRVAVSAIPIASADTPRIHTSASQHSAPCPQTNTTLELKLDKKDEQIERRKHSARDRLWKRMTAGLTVRPSRRLAKKASKQMRREHKATVTLAVVLAVFLFCWLPFFVLHLSNSLCALRTANACINPLAFLLATWLGYLNSSLNPLIYTVFDQRFRNAFRVLLHCTRSK